jgi:hypothetical protein
VDGYPEAGQAVAIWLTLQLPLDPADLSSMNLYLRLIRWLLFRSWTN